MPAVSEEIDGKRVSFVEPSGDDEDQARDISRIWNPVSGAPFVEPQIFERALMVMCCTEWNSSPTWFKKVPKEPDKCTVETLSCLYSSMLAKLQAMFRKTMMSKEALDFLSSIQRQMSGGQESKSPG